MIVPKLIVPKLIVPKLIVPRVSVTRRNRDGRGPWREVSVTGGEAP